jgi:hypothetical protein
MKISQFTLFILLSALSFEAIVAVDLSFSYEDPETNSGAPLSLINNEIEHCGNGVCDSGESCHSCPTDCISHTPVCGDGICEEGENCETCDADCNGELVDASRGLFCCYGGDEEPQGISNAASCSDSRCATTIWLCNPTSSAYSVVMVHAMEKKRLAIVQLMDVNVAMVCATMVKIPIIVQKTAHVIIMVSAKRGKRRKPALSIVLVGIMCVSLNLARPYLLVNMTVVVIEIMYVKHMKILNTVLRIVQRRIFQMHLLMKKRRRKFRIVCRCVRMIIRT